MKRVMVEAGQCSECVPWLLAVAIEIVSTRCSFTKLMGTCLSGLQCQLCFDLKYIIQASTCA